MSGETRIDPLDPRLDRVVVIGTSCSGKSTLAARLSAALDVPRIELDELHWGPDWQMTPPEAFRARVATAVEGPRWVCAGNYFSVRDVVWPRATAVVWLDLSFTTTFGRAVWRTARRTFTRERVCGDNRERWLGFLDRDWIPYWVVRTWPENRRRFTAAIESGEYAPLDFVVLRDDEAVERFARSQASSARVASTSSSSARSAPSSS